MIHQYFEIEIKVDKFKEEILNFLIERFFNGIEERGNSLILRSETRLDDLLKDLREYVKSLEELFNTTIHLEIDIREKDNLDWINKFKESIKPVEIGSFYIRPTWEDARKDKIEIIIDPALAFGTGHHESTRSCLLAIDKYVKEGQKVLDLGCGSGILGIAAAKKGAIVDLCDTDPVAIEATKKNFELNQVKYNRLWLGSIDKADDWYDLIIANIVADVLVFLANDIKKRSNFLILSGIIEKYREKVINKYSEYEIVEEIKDNEWLTIILKGMDGK
jgi:ribosomal protein L11 methyltransferase